MPRNAWFVVVCTSGLVAVACANAPVDPLSSSETNTNLPDPDADGGAEKAPSTGGHQGGGANDAGSGSSSHQTVTPDPSDPGSNPGSNPTPPTTPPANNQCATATTFDACMSCCSSAHQNGSDTFYGTLIDCLCRPQNCAYDCDTTMCNPIAPTQPDAYCNACIQQYSGSCQNSVSAACNSDPDCVAFDKCVGDSQCSNKP